MAPLVLLAVVVLAIWWFGGRNAWTLHELAEYREPLRAWVALHTAAALGAYVIVYAVLVTASLPVGALLSITGGFLFGWLAGGAAAVVASTTGAIAFFLLARGALAEPLARRCGPRLEKLRCRFHDHAVSYLLFLRLVPVFPFWLVNLAPALLGVKLRDYVVATFFGVIPGGFALALAGAGLDATLAAHYRAYQLCVQQNPGAHGCRIKIDPSSLLTPELLIAFAVLGVIALVPAIVKRVVHGGDGRGIV
jgi:uncharacterized membrane protein YdjX (TVP38/TMEM64 family)